MYLHLGQNIVILQSAVIGIFDLDNTTQSHITRKFLNRLEMEGKIINVSDELPKSFIVCKEKKDVRVYLSQISTATLLKRCESVSFE